jgi:hypothetical protein
LKTALLTTSRDKTVEAQIESPGILNQVNEAKRDRACCAPGLLKIIEEPVRLPVTEAR